MMGLGKYRDNEDQLVLLQILSGQHQYLVFIHLDYSTGYVFKTHVILSAHVVLRLHKTHLHTTLCRSLYLETLNGRFNMKYHRTGCTK